jgi:hypothetical protein
VVKHIENDCMMVRVRCIADKCEEKVQRGRLYDHIKSCKFMREECEKCGLEKGLVDKESHNCIVALKE